MLNFTQTRLNEYSESKEQSQEKPFIQYNNLKSSTTNQILSDICTKVYNQLLKRKRNKPNKLLEINAEFYPYTNIKLTSRNRGNKLLIRFSDILSDAPLKVLTGAAYFIISQQLGLKCPPEKRMIYRDYIYSDEIRKKKRKIRQSRAMKWVTGSSGKHHDLVEIFNNVNELYFNGACEKPKITWSSRKSKNRLGHFDPDLNTLVITKQLDDKKTPKYIVQYVLYHELLHARHPGKYINGKWCVHTKEFKEAEKKFEKLTDAKKWIKNNRL